MKTIVGDIEIYWNCFLAGFKNVDTGQNLILEESDRSTIDRDRLRRILLSHRFVGFNSLSFDAPLLWMMAGGASVRSVKAAANKIINGGLKFWEVERELGVDIPQRFKDNHYDLIEPQPNPFASLKILNARMHGEELRDLPYDPEKVLTHDEIDQLRIYLERSDLPATLKLWHAMAEGMDLRKSVGDSIGKNVMSKSDTQMGLAIIRKRAEDILGRRIDTQQAPKYRRSFKYEPPAYIEFKTPVLRDMLQRIRDHEFIVGADGKVGLPDWLANTPITIGPATYAMGIGGLHSTESNRSIKSTDTHVLVDFDVASYYPAIILSLGLYPEAVGQDFLKVYDGIRADRLKAKKRAKEIKDKIKKLKEDSVDETRAEIAKLEAELKEAATAEKALKVSLNGTFGSLGSRFSFVYAPNLMIAVTLTGQLALLMLIERAHLIGIPAVSGNTDGVVFFCPRNLFGGLNGDRVNPSPLADLIETWERDTGFTMEGTEYSALYNQSVNSYIALKANGGHKRKGPVANPWNKDPNDFDPRGQLMKNPQMTICSDAVLARIKVGTPIRETIRNCTDIRQFITVIKVTAGATWRGRYLGKTIRYYWSTDGDDILESKPNAKTGHFKKVPRTDGAAECMTLPAELPDDIDYDRYIAEAESILKDFGFYGDVRPPEKRIRMTKANKLSVLSAWSVAA